MKKRIISTLLTATLAVSLLAGCGGSKDAGTTSDSAAAGGAAEETAAVEPSGDSAVLEFYHGYYHDESEWAPAKVMRDIYDEFANQHADGPVEFKPIPVENRAEITQNMIAGGSFPNVTDLAGDPVPLAAISGGLVLDMKPYIDENNLKDAVGINYEQNQVDGAIYSVHDQILTQGVWYNEDVLSAAGCSADDLKTWDGFAKVVDKVSGDNYAYIAGQSSVQLLRVKMTEAGATDMLLDEITSDVIESDEFAKAFKEVAALDQKNGSDHTTDDVGNMMDDFNTNGNVAVLHNGVWNAGAINEDIADSIKPGTFPGNASLLSAGGGITIASGMTADQEALALEFMAYMVSPEVQEKIFTEVQANPCNSTVDVVALANASGDPIVAKLAEACDLCNKADVLSPGFAWGGDIQGAIINAFMECAVDGADIDARFDQLKSELIAIVG